MVHGRVHLENVVVIGGGEDFARFDPAIPQGAVAEVFYRTPGFNFDRRMRVYTPPNYGAKQETLPVLFLLHGGSGSEDTWPKLGRANFILDNLIAQGKAKRMIVAMIDATSMTAILRRQSRPDQRRHHEGHHSYLEANYMVSKDQGSRHAGQSRAARADHGIRAQISARSPMSACSASRSRVGGFRKEMEALKTDADWKAFGDMVDKLNTSYWTVGNQDGGAPGQPEGLGAVQAEEHQHQDRDPRRQPRMAGVAAGAARLRAEDFPVVGQRAPASAGVRQRLTSRRPRA